MYDLIRDTGEKKNISGVPETMIQTLYARAKESKKKNHFIYDEQAIDIVSKLDYDFSKADKDMKMSSGVIARTIMLDKMVKEYISKHPEATVVNIACGMDTRVYRVDNEKIRWYNIDLPETINIRKRFFDEDGRIKMIACSAMDEKWGDEIGETEGDVLVVIEGLTMYLSEADVKKILDIISSRFSNNNVTLFIEFMSPFVVKRIKEKSIDQSGAKFTWGVSSGKEIAALSDKISFVEDKSLVEGMQVMYPVYKVIGKIKPVRNISNKIAVLKNKI
ncbi:MAG: class I SAM-dependent methyltransferase [Lachnospiraceae bacterium]|nr:class I SAM-dependent methyltransferase [Lachnospiraceae bacterium]